MADRAAIAAAVSHGVIDDQLAALLWVLADNGVPLVVASRSSEAATTLLAAFTEAGGVLLAESFEEVLRLAGAPAGNLPDELRELGIVVIVGQASGAVRVTAAHYVRRLERDAAGHVQRRPPAVLAAWDPAERKLEHFWWAITAELADHAGMTAAELETRQDDRVGFLRALVAEHTASGHHH